MAETREPIEVAIIGAGAAGLMAALSAGRARSAHGVRLSGRVVAFDGARHIGAKILVAGGGRCNVTHHQVQASDFAGGSAHAIAKVLRTFSVADTIAFFRELGVELKREETGKLFPVSDDAHTVLQALLEGCEQAGVEIRGEHRVQQVLRNDQGFTLHTSQGWFEARRVVVATGGLSLPKTGSDGGGYELVKTLGHTVTQTWPALVPLVLAEGHWLTSLSGIAMEVELMLLGGTGKVFKRVSGAMLLTHFGLSGPAVLDMSRFWTEARRTDPAAKLCVNWLAPDRYEQVDGWLTHGQAGQRSKSLGSQLESRLPRRWVERYLSASQVEAGLSLNQLRSEDRRRLVHGLTQMELPVVRDRGYTFAEVTAGGVPLSEIHLATMASRKCQGLFLCGEICDVDGRIGGFNFQWAWASGRLAGQSAAQR